MSKHSPLPPSPFFTVFSQMHRTCKSSKYILQYSKCGKICSSSSISLVCCMVTNAARHSFINLIVHSFSFLKGAGGNIQLVYISSSLGSSHLLTDRDKKIICCNNGGRNLALPPGTHRHFRGSRIWPPVKDGGQFFHLY